MVVSLLKISEGAKYILDRLNEEGEGYLVGGVVRDHLLGIASQDEDICTSLLPEEVSRLFSSFEQRENGLKHGTLGILLDGGYYEITTFRKDGVYKDRRRPESVEFTPSLEDDLARRDFTINALAMDGKGRIIDPFGGQNDLREGLVRAVGKPKERFSEDALRLLRAVRFANRLAFRIEEETEAAIRDQAHLLEEIAKERIADEFIKILLDNPDGVTSLHELGLLQYAYPDLDACFLCDQETPYHLYDVGRHSVLAAKAHPDLVFRLTALMHDLGKVKVKTVGEEGRAHFYGHAKWSAILARQMLRDLFISKKEAKLIVTAVRYHDFLSRKPSKLAALLRLGGPELMDLIFRMKWADIMAQSPLDRERKIRLIEIQEAIYQKQLKGPYKLSHLAVKGDDLVALGYRGKAIAKALRDILIFVMEKPSRNRKSYLLERAERMRDSHYLL